MKQLYVVPFMGIGRRITLDVSFRFREPGANRDVKVINYDRVWTKSPFEDLPGQVDQWALLLLSALEKAQSEDYTLVSPNFESISRLVYELNAIRWLYDMGYGEREAAVSKFLMLLHHCDSASA